MLTNVTSLDELASYIDGYCTTSLSPYLNSLSYSRIALSAKEISDPIWNTIGLDAFEVGVLDSPLLQRLRHIRQLGVAHWLYPGAVHTRFEHSIGVLHATDRLITAIEKYDSIIGKEYRHLLRLSALVHDIGHGIFSHVSEKSLQRLPTLTDVRSEFSEKYDLADDKKMSEILTFLMLQSAKFKELLTKLQGLCPNYSLPPGYQEKLSNLFLDKQIHEKIPLLQEVISGPFDADKLDYLLRDAHMSGLPLVPDIPRLLTKVQAITLPRNKSPINLAEGVDSVTLIGIALSGARTLDELMLARTWLFDKVYRHHKVRAVEGMISIAIERLHESVKKSDFWKIVLDNDDRFLFIDEYQIVAGEAESQNKQVIKTILHRIRSRELFCRCYAWSQTASPQETFGATDTPFDRLYRVLTHNDSAARLNLCKEIAGECRKIIDLLNIDIDQQTKQNLDFLIVVDPPKIQKKASEIPRAFLITPDNGVIEFKKDSSESLALTNAYLVAGDLGYVFGPREFALPINIATEKIFYAKFNFRNTPSSLQYTKLSQTRINEAKGKLQALGYYVPPFNVLKSPPLWLKNSLAEKSLDSLESHFANYQGVANDQRESGAYKVSKDAIIRWLMQFEDDAIMKIAFKILASMRVIGRSEIVDALSSFLKTDNLEGAKWLCPLGGPQDSSAIYSYLGADVSTKFNIRTAELSHALGTEDRILFFDDFIGSGQQAISIFSTWLGLDQDTDSQLNETRIPLPTEELKEKLRQKKIEILLYSGLSSGVKNLFDWAKEKSLNIKIHISKEEATIPNIDNALTSEELVVFKKFSQEIGMRILDDGVPKHNENWRQERSLGYGNKGLLLAFPFNIPSQSLTCLWGENKNIPWSPLFRRRKKL